MTQGIRLPSKQQVAIILDCSGSSTVDFSGQSVFSDPSDKKNSNKLVVKLKVYCSPQKVEVFRCSAYGPVPTGHPSCNRSASVSARFPVPA